MYNDTMLIIGHRGAAGLAPENTIAAIAAGIEAGSDMIEIDVRLTRDNQLVVIHDPRLVRTHRSRESISNLTYDGLIARSGDRPIPLLEQVLDAYFGKVLFNIEIKSRGAAEQLVRLLKRRYIHKATDWDNLIISSYKAAELMRVRRLVKRANLAMLHNSNPFIFVAYQRALRLTAVGFHRLYLNRFALEIARRAHIFIYVFTVDRPGAIPYLEAQGVEGIVTNHPDRMVDYIKKHRDHDHGA